MAVNKSRRKSRPRLPVDDDESDGAQADEEPLAGSMVRIGMGLVNVNASKLDVRLSSLISNPCQASRIS